MLDILAQIEGGRRVQHFILWESSVNRMPTAAMWCVFWCLTGEPRGMTDAGLGEWVREWEGMLRVEVMDGGETGD